MQTSQLQIERDGAANSALTAAALAPPLSARWMLDVRCLACAAVLSVFFAYHNYLPLFHSDLWGHVAYGEWMLQHGRLPTEEPFVPLAEGVPIVASAWLSQVLLAGAVSGGDPEWLGHVFAVTVTLTVLLLARAYSLQTGRWGLSFVAALIAWLIAWSRHAVIRPEIFGGLCFAALLQLVVRLDSRGCVPSASCAATTGGARGVAVSWRTWLAIPCLFALWANLHGSFVVGFILLGCQWAGRAAEVLWRTGRPLSVLQDSAVQRWLWATELAVGGALVNPYGFDLLVYALAFSAHPNLRSISEWFPLQMNSLEGIPMAASWLLTATLLRHSRVRLTPADVLLLLVFNVLVCLRVRMIAWYAPVAMLVLAPHLVDVCRQVADSEWGLRLEGAAAWWTRRSQLTTALTVFVVWVTFAWSPISRPVLGGKPRPADQVFSHDTPLGVTRYLKSHPPQGLVAAPQWWGDWLLWTGPPGLQVMMTTNAAHVAPPQVWNDYLEIAEAQAGLERRLERYRINTIIVGKKLQPELQRAVERLDGWRVAFEDDVGLVAVRRRPKPRDAGSDESPATAAADVAAGGG